jgi:BlaI family transcriptional regulator, penicillinase repressor
MPELPEVSKSEWVIIKLCWEHRRATARQIFEAVAGKRDWEYQTVKTLLDRLVAKGYLKMEKLGPLCLYDPIVARSRAMRDAISTFMDTVLDNSVGPLMAYLARSGKLSARELDELKRLVSKSKEDGK